MSGLYRGEIPGLYWDREKHKYFTIQKNHAAPPGTQYTQANVHRLKLQAKKDRASDALNKASKTQRVQRSKLSTSFLSGHTLSRESATATPSLRNGESRARMYGVGLCNAEILYSSKAIIQAFSWDEMFGGTITSSYELGRALATPDVNFVSLQRRKRKTVLSRASSTVSSFSKTPSGTLCYTTLGIDDTAEVKFLRFQQSSERFHPPEIAYPCTSLSIDGSAFSSAANPFRGEQDMVAVGASGYALLIRYNAALNHAPNDKLDLTSDALAIEWLDPNTVSLGHRDGRIVLWDVRSKGQSSRLWHPSCINDIKRVDANTLVVGGLLDNLNMYDLRMPVKIRGGHKHKRAKTGVSEKTGNTSHPIIRYDYSNRFQKLGFDVDVSNGILAAGDDDDHVNIYSLHSGDLINRFQPLIEIRETSPNRGPFNISGLSFCKSHDDEDFLLGSSGRFLWASKWSNDQAENKLSLQNALGEEYYMR